MINREKDYGKSAQPKSRPRYVSLFLSLLCIGFIIPILAGCDVANSLAGEGADSTAQTATPQPSVAPTEQPSVTATQQASAAATQQPTVAATQQPTFLQPSSRVLL